MTSAVGSSVLSRVAPSSVVIGRSPQQSAVDPVAAETERPLPSVVFNPRIRFDYEARLIVQEFRNTTTGEIDRSVPTERQLQAYIDAQRLRPGRSEPAISDSAATSSSGVAQGDGAVAAGTDRRSAEPIVRPVIVPITVNPDVVTPSQNEGRVVTDRTPVRVPVAPAPALAIQV